MNNFCQPTSQEKDIAVNGKLVVISSSLYPENPHRYLRWVREGVYKFGFELRK
jgi:hypothetical protein